MRFDIMSMFLLKELVNRYFASRSILLIFCSEVQVLLCSCLCVCVCVCVCVYCNMCVKSWYLACLYFSLFCSLLCTPLLTSRTRSVFPGSSSVSACYSLCTLEYVTVFHHLLFFRLFCPFLTVFLCFDLYRLYFQLFLHIFILHSVLPVAEFR